PGAEWLLDRADAIAGLRDDVSGFAALADRHPVVRRLARRFAGLRLPATGRVFHHGVPAVLSQKVTRDAARRGYVGLLHRLAEPAPGPRPGLRLPPPARAVATMPYWLLHPLGVERRRAEILRRAALEATRLDATTEPATAARRLTALPGVGPWTVAEVVRLAFADADVVSVGDCHLPSMVAHALVGESRADDARMLELLEPFRGHRGRVCRLLLAAGRHAPRFGPRLTIGSIADR
ncbi:MAG: DNA-3-methyladenine glycosylase 2 family protein, partial [Dactylosporangium sp.]|nr:DNA-3-methyladenine glycosylase 2 family protein [Dactylosporangium sp.]NNJ61258.1 DNA-3-methyladenine glycosylase 2 family protein [Dactylosporangium sp.]